ncbi:MAG: hypothetical protein OXB88_05085 [Bacteriovoracales bacterium]|nr:hypothetical protein [Bacteriovoracales bacterium]
MKNKFFPIIIATLFFSSCELETLNNISDLEEGANLFHPDTDKEFYKYIQNFSRLAKKYNLNLAESLRTTPITFSNDISGSGVCYRTYQEGEIIAHEIEIKKSSWNSDYGTIHHNGKRIKIRDIIRETVVYHELGHCILNRDHDSTLGKNRVSNAIPMSLMYPSTKYARYYMKYYNAYIRELFTKSKNGFTSLTLIDPQADALVSPIGQAENMDSPSRENHHLQFCPGIKHIYH